MFIEKALRGIDLEVRDNKNICDWGTKHKEECEGEETHRTTFRRERDRILYTGGFRRLQDKTQVLAATESGDHRTRLTHTLEVEQIAVSIADALGLNKDLVSAIAIGHDIGHTPFGHAVERYLNKVLENEGGFSHAVQSIRYLKRQEIELSYEIFEGILKHDSDIYAGCYDRRQFDCNEYYPTKPASTLEAQVVFWADKLAYITHDFEDFFKSNIYENAIKYDKRLEKKLKNIFHEIIIEPDERRIEIKKDIRNFKTRDFIRNLIGNLIEQSLENLQELKSRKGKINSTLIQNETEKRILDCKFRIDVKEAYQRGLLITLSEDYLDYYQQLKRILKEHYIDSPEVARTDAKAEKIAKTLFEEFVNNIKLLPLNIQKQIHRGESSKERIIADYIASMTDNYAREVYSDLDYIGSYYKF